MTSFIEIVTENGGSALTPHWEWKKTQVLSEHEHGRRLKQVTARKEAGADDFPRQIPVWTFCISVQTHL